MRAVIGIGANLGDRLATMRDAVRRIEGIAGVRSNARSTVYETAPVGLVDQPAFLNAAISVECTISPRALLEVGTDFQIERRGGHQRFVGSKLRVPSGTLGVAPCSVEPRAVQRQA